MKYIKANVFVIGIFLFLLIACSKEKADPTQDRILCDTIAVSFSNDLVPIFERSCSNPPYASCHTWVTDYDAIKSKVKNGSFDSRVLEIKDMPPTPNSYGIDTLSSEELLKIRCWIFYGSIDN